MVCSAVSAANLGLWPESINYFQQAIRSSDRGNEDIDAYLLGLQGDLSLALHESRDVSGALEVMEDLLAKLENLPSNTVQSRYVHLVVRHVVLWMHGESIGKPSIAEDGNTYTIYVGICSNPNPHPGLASRQIPHLAIAGYFLANTEIFACKKCDIASSLKESLGQVCLPSLELMQVHNKMGLLIEMCDTDGVLKTVCYYLGLQQSVGGDQQLEMDYINPRFRPLPQSVEKSDQLNDLICFHLDDVLCSILISVALQDSVEKYDKVLFRINRMFGTELPSVIEGEFEVEISKEGRLKDLYPTIFAILSTAPLPAEALFVATFKLFSISHVSPFRDVLCRILCPLC